MKRQPVTARRILIMGTLFSAAFLLIIIRLFMIQIVHGEYYAYLADNQQSYEVTIGVQRGEILDRNGISFTRAKAYSELIIFPSHIHPRNRQTHELVSALTGIALEPLAEEKSPLLHRLRVIHGNPELEEQVAAGEHPGIILYRGYERYDDASLARHVVGHLRQSDGYPVTGMEKVFGEMLEPTTTHMVSLIIDAARKPLMGLDLQERKYEGTSQHVTLTLDYPLQRILESVLDQYPGRHHGGLVVEAATGEIIALASRPQYRQYDPFPQGDESISFLAIPFQQYPLGSVYKTVVAAAALESGLFDAESPFLCTGGIQVGQQFIPCHSSSGGLGEITLREAFAHSCNDTFIRVAQEIGGDAIIEMSQRLGLGTALPLELENASGRLMTDRQAYNGPGIANLALGQGDTLVTPLQIAYMMTAIVNQGRPRPLRLVREPILTELKQADKMVTSILDPAITVALMEWMADVTEYGTAMGARDAEIGGTAGKTGTPQVSGDSLSSSYSWFAGYYPRENPKYVIVIMSKETGGAVPVFYQTARGIWEYEGYP